MGWRGKNNRVQQSFGVGVDQGGVKSYRDPPQPGPESPGVGGLPGLRSCWCRAAGLVPGAHLAVTVRAKWRTPR